MLASAGIVVQVLNDLADLYPQQSLQEVSFLMLTCEGDPCLQGDMQCGTLSDDDEDEVDDKDKIDDSKTGDKGEADHHKSASRATSFNPQDSCELCHVPLGLKDGKPSPWMWSRSTSFASPDNPF